MKDDVIAPASNIYIRTSSADTLMKSTSSMWLMDFFWCSRGFARRTRIRTHFSKLRPSCLNHPLRLMHSFIAQILHSQAGNWCNLAQCRWPTHTLCNLFAIFGFFFFLFVWGGLFPARGVAFNTAWFIVVISLFISQIAHITVGILN